MTEKDGFYYCDICHDKEPIAKGEGFVFNNPMFPQYKHAHQRCYKVMHELGKEFLHDKRK